MFAASISTALELVERLPAVIGKTYRWLFRRESRPVAAVLIHNVTVTLSAPDKVVFRFGLHLVSFSRKVYELHSVETLYWSLGNALPEQTSRPRASGKTVRRGIGHGGFSVEIVGSAVHAVTSGVKAGT